MEEQVGFVHPPHTSPPTHTHREAAKINHLMKDYVYYNNMLPLV